MLRELWSQRQPYWWIVWSTIVITCAAVASAVWSLTTIERRLINAAGNSVALTSEESARKIDKILEERAGDLIVLSHMRLLQVRDTRLISEHLNAVRSTYADFSVLEMTDAVGQVIASTDPTHIGTAVGEMPWFVGARDRTDLYIGELSKAVETNGKPAIVFSRAIRRENGDLLGVVAGWVAMHVFEEQAREPIALLRGQWGADSAIEYLVVTSTGGLLADSNLRQEGKVNLRELAVPSVTEVLAGETGFVLEQHGRHDYEVVTGYAQTAGGTRAPNVQWGVLVRVDVDHVRAPILTLLWKIGLGWGVVAVPMITLLLWSAKRLEKYGQEQQARATTSEAALHLHIASLRSVVDAARTLTEARDLEGVYQHLLDISRKDTGAAAAVLMVFEERPGAPPRAFTKGMSAGALTMLTRSQVGMVLIDRLMRESTPIRLKDLEEQLAAHGASMAQVPVAGLIGMSIRTRERLFGALCLMDKQSGHGRMTDFTDLDVQVVTALTAQVGVAVENLLALTHAQTQATHDSLTGLLNHSAILEALETELNRSQRNGEPVSVLLLDLDHFKAVNDTYGHSAGDQVLIETANRIRAVLRSYDSMGRAGGEEFLMVLPRCGPAAAVQLAERLRVAIGEEPFSRPAGPFHVTASIGVTSWPGGLPTSPTILVEVADEAMYRAKHSGRNRVEVGVPRIGPQAQEMAG
ncbi:MAG: diguanylate cyclase [Nitrospiraceae bacterium]